MAGTSQALPKNRSISDYAIDGLAAGFIAGLLMVTYLIGAGLSIGLSPANILSSFRVQDPNTSLAGILLHLAVSGVYGTIFGSSYHPLIGKIQRPSIGILTGALYGVLLYLLARGAILPSTNSPLLQFPSAHLLVAHLIYGFILGWLVNHRSSGG
jgi:uncharacterized membrane protein YagU involved in acid resistance